MKRSLLRATAVIGATATACAALFLLSDCGGGAATAAAPAASAASASSTSRLSLVAQVGEKLFADPTLSASGRQSCASCHDPQAAQGPSNALAVQLGGPALALAGLRSPPSLRYKDATPAYADLLDNPDGISAPGPGGGFTWDGRAPTLAEQAKLPLLDPREMANASADDVVRKIQASASAPLFLQAFGADAFADPAVAFDHAVKALQAYQVEDAEFHPYTSKFDRYAANKIGGTLTAAEARGLAVFANPQTGNCASCHYQGAGLNGSSALFTDFSYEAIGVPRNPAIPANADPAFFDLGLCGPERTDHQPSPAGSADRFCGMFKAPTLRNVATRRSFFHNGVMHSLEQVIRFYNTRDTRPELWYPTVGGTPKATPDPDFPTYGLVTAQYVGGRVQKFDDLPAAQRPNIDTQLPMDGRAAGSAPPMSEQDIGDLLCFLYTLTDADQQPAVPLPAGRCGD